MFGSAVADTSAFAFIMATQAGETMFVPAVDVEVLLAFGEKTGSFLVPTNTLKLITESQQEP